MGHCIIVFIVLYVELILATKNKVDERNCEMENIYFDQIFNFNRQNAKKLQNSSYLEDLTGLFEKSATSITSGKPYCFSSEYYLKNPTVFPNSSYDDFIAEFKNSFFNSAPDKVHIIRGRPGVGKTLFFNKGIQLLLRDKDFHNEKYIKLGIDFMNIDAMGNTEYYTEYMRKKLKINAIDAIRQLGQEEQDAFHKEYKAFCKNKYDTPFEAFYPLYFFCREIHKRYSRPGIIILDNIDLACINTQENVFKATAIISKEFFDFMSLHSAQNQYRIYFAMRPETVLRSNEMNIGQVINFPVPDIQAIALETIKHSLKKTAIEFDKNDQLKCEVTYYDVITGKLIPAKTFNDIADYFIQVLNHFFNKLWDDPNTIERLDNCQDFHCKISNYNIRTFLNFLSDTLSNGGFKPLTKNFMDNPNDNHYRIFDYIEMIIKGRWEVYPGNKHIDGEGGNKAPLVFNLFDTSLYRSPEDKISHFLLFVHILNILNEIAYEKTVFYGDIEDELSLFFQKEHIKKAMQQLVFVHIVYSYDEVDDNVACKKSYEEIEVSRRTPLRISETGVFYIEKFICEFEYLYQMALSSIMPFDYVERLKSCWRSEKELTVLYFLKSIFVVIKNNIDKLNPIELITYKKTFTVNSTYLQMINSFINVLQRKIYKAEANETKSIEKLRLISSEAELLRESVEEYLKQK